MRVPRADRAVHDEGPVRPGRRRLAVRVSAAGSGDDARRGARLRSPNANDLVIFTYGNGVPMSLRAAREIEKEHGWKVRVVDLRWLVPLNEALIARHAREERSASSSSTRAAQVRRRRRGNHHGDRRGGQRSEAAAARGRRRHVSRRWPARRSSCCRARPISSLRRANWRSRNRAAKRDAKPSPSREAARESARRVDTSPPSLPREGEERAKRGRRRPFRRSGAGRSRLAHGSRDA